MFRKNDKNKRNSKDKFGGAMVTQDSRTTVKTTTAQSETTNTTVQNATIFNSQTNKVTYETTRQTVTHQQQARITEVQSRHTATEAEIEEMLRQLSAGTGNPGANTGAAGLPVIPKQLNNTTNGLYSNNNSSNKAKGYTSTSALAKLKSNSGNRSIFNYDSPSFTSAASNKVPPSPTILRTHETSVMQNSGSTVTSRVEQQRIKFSAVPRPPASANSPFFTNGKAYANSSKNNNDITSISKITPIKLSSPNSPLSNYNRNTSNTGNSYKIDAKLMGGVTETPLPARPFPNWLSPATSSPISGPRPAVVAPKIISSTPAPLPVVAAKKKSSLRPGVAFIFNNVRFDDPKNELRVGSAEDVKSLQQVFRHFKLEFKEVKDATLKEISKTVEKIATRDYSKHSCLVLVILTHGSRHDEVAAKDGNYSIDDEILFPILKNRTLNDKPKILFIQACKGNIEVGKLQKDATRPAGSPNEILKCNSTFEGYVSYRTKEGSLFIQALCECLMRSGSFRNIRDILDDVIRIVKQQSQSLQIPSVTSTLSVPYVFGDYV